MFYDGKKLLSKLDLNNAPPGIFICAGNRSTGKTTFFNKMLVDRFLEYGEQFVLFYRFTYELSNVHEAFFDDIRGLFFPNFKMDSVPHCRGTYRQLFLNDQPCGFAVALNCANTIKRESHIFNQCSSILMDEFQSETNKYCEDEVTKFLSVYQSIARGKGQMSRLVKVYMLSNCITLLNPYYSEFGVTERLRSDTKFLRGNGWVLEQNYNAYASKAMQQNPVINAFSRTKALAYAAENVYMNDCNSFITRLKDSGRYMLGYTYEGQYYHITKLKDSPHYYVNQGYDKQHPLLFAINPESHNESTVLAHNPLLVQMLRTAFQNGLFRFRDLKAKQSLMLLIKY